MNGHAGGTNLAEWLAGSASASIEESGLDARTHALVRLAALLAAGDARAACDQLVTQALDHGVTPDEVAGVLVALLPAVGVARVSAVAPVLRAALARAVDVPLAASSRPA